MTDQLDPGPVRELTELRAGIPGRTPGELHRARALLLAEIEAERATTDRQHPSYPPRGPPPPRAPPPPPGPARPPGPACRGDRGGGRGGRRHHAGLPPAADRPP